MDDQTRLPLKARTLLAQALSAGDPVTKALVPPIHMSATYLRDPDNGYSGGYVYGRTDNASIQQVEALLAVLEGAAEAITFASGMAAATSVFLALEKPTHIVASRVMYWGFRSWLQQIGRYGHSITFVETSDLRQVREAVRPGETGLFWIETPSNPLWTITDISAVSEIAHDANAILCVDFNHRHAGVHPSNRPRGGHRHSFRYEISQWPLGYRCWCVGNSAGERSVGANSRDTGAARSTAGAV